MFVSMHLKSEIVEQYETIKTLEEKCKSCKLFGGREPDATFMYLLSEPIRPKIDAIVAISQYGETYAIYSPEYLNWDEMMIFSVALNDIDLHEEIVVFTQRDYDAANKYLRGRKNKIILYR